MSETILEQVKALVKENSHSGVSLTLFALMKTLSSHNHQYLFLLNKLRDLSPEHRQLAYGLMEIMAEKGNETPEWDQAVVAIEEMIRGG